LSREPSGNPDAAAQSAGYRVAAQLKGNFPGGEADVEYRFGIRHGLICRLRIT
jgi:hypothetical protein